ncbi:hypothetical protein POF51_30705 [Brevibacillus sp. AG]|uniref:hypothetical protein n=1 Tax=Brevibacillus sp. AG TaxID=3020891 RepID=UPI00085337AF|nr:hypothetical protein [Brevibacillus sp. AG]MDC0765096.1 hypothetical protein [Brevibacillus sp. AG]
MDFGKVRKIITVPLLSMGLILSGAASASAEKAPALNQQNVPATNLSNFSYSIPNANYVYSPVFNLNAGKAYLLVDKQVAHDDNYSSDVRYQLRKLNNDGTITIVGKVNVTQSTLSPRLYEIVDIPSTGSYYVYVKNDTKDPNRNIIGVSGQISVYSQ